MQGQQSCFLRFPNQTDLYPSKFPAQTIPCLGSANEQRHWLRLYLGATGRNSFCQDPSTDYCKPLLPSSVTIRFPVFEHHRNSAISVRHDWSGGSQKVMLSELNVHPGLSFLTGGTVGSGEASWHGTPPAWERSSAVAPALAQLCTVTTPLF